MKKIIFVILGAGVLSGCATTSMYVVPVNNQPTSSIRSYELRKGISHWDQARIVSIDNKYVSYTKEDLLGISIKNKKIPVVAGPHTFDISTTFNRGLFSGVSEAYSEVNAILVAGNDYQVNEAVEGTHVKVWITNQNGKIVSPIVAEPFHAKPVQTIYTPIIIR
jgi:hypothetical protein